MADRKRIAVLFGGRSVEHEISIITALQLIAAVDTVRFDVLPVYIAHSGRWYTGNALLDRATYRSLPASLRNLTEVMLHPVPGQKGLTVAGKGSLFGRLAGRTADVVPIDLYIPAFHGTYGEDGCIQALLELADVPYAGCDVAGSALAMDKYLCKLAARGLGIPVLPEAVVERSAARKDLNAACERVLATAGLSAFPLFVKPRRLGSSIGVSRAADRDGLAAGLTAVFQHDTHAIVEPCVTDIMEINVSVLGASVPLASVTEVPVAASGVLSYEEKYMRKGGAKKTGGGGARQSLAQGMAGLARVIDPLDLDPALKEAVNGYALRIAEALCLGGVGRFDFIYDAGAGKLYFNELNPIPGSFSYYLWEKSQPPVLYTELINRIVAEAETRYRERHSLQRDTGFKAMFG